MSRKESLQRVFLPMHMFGDLLLRQIQVCLTGAGAPKAPLCKGSCQPNRLTEGLLPQYDFAETVLEMQDPTAQSLRHGFAVPPPFTQGRLWSVRNC